MYTIFVRNWWRAVRTQFGTKLEPAAGARRTVIAHANSEEEARRICKEYNDSHNPGKLSRKAEYTNQF